EPRDRDDVEEAGDPARELVAEGRRQEPDAHHESDDPRRGELRDEGEADGGKAQLPEGVYEVERRQPEGADADPARLRGGRGGNEDQEAEPHEEESRRELRGARGLPLSHRDPHPREN